jgi:predicted MFS family arabinose efflux permease
LALLFLVSFFNYLDRMVIAVMVEPMKRDLALSDTQLGLVSGLAFALLYATCGIPLARFADQRSRKWLLTICLAIWSTMTALTGLARNFTELFAARMAVGVGEAGCVPASHSMIGDMFPPERRALAVGIFQAGGLIGLSVGLAAAGMAAEVFGWRKALIGVGLLGLPLALLMALTMREPERQHAVFDEENASAALAALARSRPLVHLVIGIAIGSFATYGMAQWLPAFFIRSHGLSLTGVGFYGGITAGIGGVLGTLAGGWAMVHLRPRDQRWELWLPACSYLGCIPFYLTAFWVESAILAYGIKFFGIFIAAAGGGVALAAIQTFAEPHRRATAVAVMMFLSSLIGLGLGPAAVGAISDALTSQFGTEALRYALMISTAFLAWAGLHFVSAARAPNP